MPTRLISSLAAYLAPLSGLHAQELLGIDDRRENIHLVAPLGIFVALLFSGFNILLTPYTALGLIEAAAALGLLLPAFIMARHNRAIEQAETLVMLCGLIVFSSLVIIGGVGGSGLYWAFCFPFLTFFMKGQRKGWPWILAFLLIISILLVGLRGTRFAYPYDPVQIPHFLASLLFMTVIASCFNLLRSRFQEKLQQAVQSNTATAQRYLSELQYLALHDKATSLPNRARLDLIVSDEVERAEARDSGLVCVFLRLQRMAETSNIIGSDGTDNMMRQLSHALKEQLGDNGVLGRPGREELMLLYRLRSRTIDSQQVIDAIKRSEFSFTINDFPVHIEFTCGVAIYPPHATDAANLVQKAEQAMLRAIHSATDICIYDPALEKQFVQYHYRFGKLRKALQEQALNLHYQPLVNLQTGRIECVEALSRWFDREEGTIPPDQFIPIAESSGLIKPLTRWSLREAMTQCQKWQAVMPGVGVAINLSSRSLHDPGLTATLMDELLETGISPELITLELTESILLDAPDKALGIMKEIVNMGMKLAIDDYGTGFSSLAYLKHLPAHELKIDQSFIRHLTEDSGDLAIVNSTINLAHDLGLRVIAEGIESEDIMQQLWLLGCDIGQGYFFSKPMPLSEFLHWGRHYHFAPPQVIAPCDLTHH